MSKQVHAFPLCAQESSPDAHLICGLTGLKGGGSFQGMKNQLVQPGIDHRISVPWPSHYTDNAIPAPIEKD
jgi:hypothetical protein